MRISKENIKLKDNEIIELIKIDQFKQGEKEKYVKELLNISKAVGQDPEGYVYEWLKKSDLFLFAKSKKFNSPIGFTLANFYRNEDIIYIPAAMVLPQYQKKEIATKFIKKIVKIFFLHKLKYSLKDIFSPFYFLFRTQNPLIYFEFYKYNLSLYPSFNKNKKTPTKINNIASKFAKILWPYASFDKNTFVLKDAYKSCPGLIVEPNNISWSKNELINKEFKKRLNLNKKSFDALIVIVEINFFSVFKAFF